MAMSRYIMLLLVLALLACAHADPGSDSQPSCPAPVTFDTGKDDTRIGCNGCGMFSHASCGGYHTLDNPYSRGIMVTGTYFAIKDLDMTNVHTVSFLFKSGHAWTHQCGPLEEGEIVTVELTKGQRKWITVATIDHTYARRNEAEGWRPVIVNIPDEYRVQGVILQFNSAASKKWGVDNIEFDCSEQSAERGTIQWFLHEDKLAILPEGGQTALVDMPLARRGGDFIPTTCDEEPGSRKRFRPGKHWVECAAQVGDEAHDIIRFWVTVQGELVCDLPMNKESLVDLVSMQIGAVAHGAAVFNAEHGGYAFHGTTQPDTRDYLEIAASNNPKLDTYKALTLGICFWPKDEANKHNRQFGMGAAGPLVQYVDDNYGPTVGLSLSGFRTLFAQVVEREEIGFRHRMHVHQQVDDYPSLFEYGPGWQHVAMTYDARLMRVKLYIRGKMVLQMPYKIENMGPELGTQSRIIRLGYVDNENPRWKAYQGYLRQMKIFTYAVGDDLIKKMSDECETDDVPPIVTCDADVVEVNIGNKAGKMDVMRSVKINVRDAVSKDTSFDCNVPAEGLKARNAPYSVTCTGYDTAIVGEGNAATCQVDVVIKTVGHKCVVCDKTKGHRGCKKGAHDWTDEKCGEVCSNNGNCPTWGICYCTPLPEASIVPVEQLKPGEYRACGKHEAGCRKWWVSDEWCKNVCARPGRQTKLCHSKYCRGGAPENSRREPGSCVSCTPLYSGRRGCPSIPQDPNFCTNHCNKKRWGDSMWCFHKQTHEGHVCDCLPPAEGQTIRRTEHQRHELLQAGTEEPASVYMRFSVQPSREQEIEMEAIVDKAIGFDGEVRHAIVATMEEPEPGTGFFVVEVVITDLIGQEAFDPAVQQGKIQTHLDANGEDMLTMRRYGFVKLGAKHYEDQQDFEELNSTRIAIVCAVAVAVVVFAVAAVAVAIRRRQRKFVPIVDEEDTGDVEIDA